MKPLIHRSLAVMALIIMLATLCMGCKHTAQGFGKDMEENGQKIQQKTQ